MQFGTAIVTNEGRSILSAASINDRIVFTRFYFQGSNVTLTENSTVLSNRWGDGHIDSYESNSSGEFIIHASASNEDSHGYAYGWGIYGKLESEDEEKLMFVANATGTVTYVDSMSGAATRFLLALTVRYSIDVSSMTIDPSYSGLVSNLEFQALLDRTVTTHSAVSSVIGDDQTILGEKTFAGTLVSSGPVYLGTRSDAGTHIHMTSPSESTGMVEIKTRSPLGWSLIDQDSVDGVPYIAMSIIDSDETTKAKVKLTTVSDAGALYIDSTTVMANSVYPSATNAYNLGSLNYIWQDAYISNVRVNTGVVVGSSRFNTVDPEDGDVICTKADAYDMTCRDNLIVGTRILCNGLVSAKNLSAVDYLSSGKPSIKVRDSTQAAEPKEVTFGPKAWCLVIASRMNDQWYIDETYNRCFGFIPELSGNFVKFVPDKNYDLGMIVLKAIAMTGQQASDNLGWGSIQEANGNGTSMAGASAVHVSAPSTPSVASDKYQKIYTYIGTKEDLAVNLEAFPPQQLSGRKNPVMILLQLW